MSNGCQTDSPLGPVLLGCDTVTSLLDWQRLPPHRDEHQVQLDVNRSFIYYPTGTITPSNGR